MSNRRRARNPRPITPVRRYNAYRCEDCGGAWLTVDVHAGTTPMFSPCFATEGCKGRAVSAGYPPGLPPAELGVALIEWYQPTDLRGLPTELVDHVQRGGLLRRATESAPDWVKALA